MTALSRAPKHSVRWANELWNVSLLPVRGANESSSFPQRQSLDVSRELRKLENLDERRSESSERHSLSAGRPRVGGNLL
jgi:hypothetical protein